MGNYDFDLDLDSYNTMSIINSWISENTKVLEFGPANGRLTRYLSIQKKCAVTIVEIDEDTGREASVYAECSYIGRERGDINNFYWYDENLQYDYIIFADVLEHLSDPESILSKCKNLLKKQGVILISIPNIAHNSVLIDLINDRFFYQKTGLLDQSHVHFFTYCSFYEMIQRLGLSIEEQQPIISEVGWNEINNHYADVSFPIERELRSRKSGNIYQYVFKVCPKENVLNALCFADLLGSSESWCQEEASCFIWNKNAGEEPTHKIGKIYPNNTTKHCLRFDLNADCEKLRFDPLENTAIVIIYFAKVKCAECPIQDIHILQHNAESGFSNVFYFKTLDPWIEFDLSNFASSIIEYIEVAFQVVDSHFSAMTQKIYDCLFDEHNPENISFSKEKFSGAIEQQAYIEYLEHDKKEQESYINHLEKDIKEQKDYVDHLEKDIFEQNSCMKRYELDIEEQKAYIAHLEKDIVTLKEYIQQLEEN